MFSAYSEILLKPNVPLLNVVVFFTKENPFHQGFSLSWGATLRGRSHMMSATKGGIFLQQIFFFLTREGEGVSKFQIFLSEKGGSGVLGIF